MHQLRLEKKFLPYVAGIFTVMLTAQAAVFGQSRFILFSPPGSTGITVGGINDSGAVGGSLAGPQGYVGFVRSFSGAYQYFLISGSSGPFTVSGINNSNTVTGWYSDSAGVIHGFIRPADHPAISFDAPGAGSTSSYGTFPQAINSAGIVVGYFSDAAGASHGFLRGRNGTVTVVDVGTCPASQVEGQGTALTGINSEGTAAGYFLCELGVSFGFSRTPAGAITNFYAPPNDAFPIYTTGINDLGEITGYFTGYGCEESACAYVFQPGAESIDVIFTGLPSVATYPASINNAGYITGYYEPGFPDTSSSSYPGFVGPISGPFTSFTVPNTSGATPTGINSKGIVAGYNVEGFLLTP